MPSTCPNCQKTFKIKNVPHFHVMACGKEKRLPRPAPSVNAAQSEDLKEIRVVANEGVCSKRGVLAMLDDLHSKTMDGHARGMILAYKAKVNLNEL